MFQDISKLEDTYTQNPSLAPEYNSRKNHKVKNDKKSKESQADTYSVNNTKAVSDMEML